MPNSERIEWIDVAKGIGIIIVVIYHCTPNGYLKNFLWQMHMPLFAFLSGMVFKQFYAENIENMKLFIIKRIKSIYLPFIKYSLCFLCLHNIFFKINFIGTINGNTLYALRQYIHQAINILTLGGGRIINRPIVVFDSFDRSRTIVCYDDVHC